MRISHPFRQNGGQRRRLIRRAFSSAANRPLFFVGDSNRVRFLSLSPPASPPSSSTSASLSWSLTSLSPSLPSSSFSSPPEWLGSIFGRASSLNLEIWVWFVDERNVLRGNGGKLKMESSVFSRRSGHLNRRHQSVLKLSSGSKGSIVAESVNVYRSVARTNALLPLPTNVTKLDRRLLKMSLSFVPLAIDPTKTKMFSSLITTKMFRKKPLRIKRTSSTGKI